MVLLAATFCLLYWDVMVKLVHDWRIDENYSHGFLVPPIAFYLAWERRQKFFACAGEPSVLGALFVLAGVGLLVLGVLGAEVFTTEISLLITAVGCVLFLYGKQALKVWIFPILFLLLMIPIPAIIFNQVAFPLQLLASRFAETSLDFLRVPALREGNVIHLATTSLEVAEACSGIRSLMSLLTLAIVYGYFMDSRPWVRVLMAIASIPVAILTNGFRVAGTGAAAYFYGPSAAEGFFHMFSGWIIFISASAMLVLIHRTICWHAK